MKYDKKQLDLREGLKKEWIISNGIGGYSSSSIIGANTRKYHGLMVAPILPPARRYLVLSKLDEALQIDGENYNLYTNMCEGFISDGYKYQETFEKKYIPIFEYKVNGISITKKVCMQYGRNTVVVTYSIINADKNLKLRIAPVVNFRDFHCMSTNHEFSCKQFINGRKVKLVIDDNRATPVYMYSAEGNYIEHNNDIFRDMYYIEEEKRGFYPKENHLVPGVYEIDIKENEKTKDITFICSLEENIEEINGNEVIYREEERLKSIIHHSGLIKTKPKMLKADKEYNEMLEDLIIASDSFIANRQAFGLHTIIAGYPWFLDWGRDALIAFEGLLLVTKRYDLAREILLMFTRDVKFGLVPNGYSGFDSRPLYNSVDSSLLLFEQVNKYLKYTGDYNFIENNLYVTLKCVIKNYIEGIDFDDNNIYVDDNDGLLVSGTDYTQNTWMDAKAGGKPVTPRNGKAVEINAMWYNALKTMEELSHRFNENDIAINCKRMAEAHKKVFNKKFYNSKKKSLYDVLGDDKIRPNQLFSLVLTYPVIDPDSKIAKTIFETCKDKLLTKYGLKSLAKGEKDFIAIYEGDAFKRDSSYHQGVTWVWLLGVYADSFKNIIKYEKNEEKKEELQKEYDKLVDTTIKTFRKAIYEDAAVGSISELYNSQTPFNPGGTISQAWSVSEILRIMLDK